MLRIQPRANSSRLGYVPLARKRNRTALLALPAEAVGAPCSCRGSALPERDLRLSPPAAPAASAALTNEPQAWGNARRFPLPAFASGLPLLAWSRCLAFPRSRSRAPDFQPNCVTRRCVVRCPESLPGPTAASSFRLPFTAPQQACACWRPANEPTRSCSTVAAWPALARLPCRLGRNGYPPAQHLLGANIAVRVVPATLRRPGPSLTKRPVLRVSFAAAGLDRRGAPIEAGLRARKRSVVFPPGIASLRLPVVAQVPSTGQTLAHSAAPAFAVAAGLPLSFAIAGVRSGLLASAAVRISPAAFAADVFRSTALARSAGRLRVLEP
jgi:hypothetical protein